MGKLKKILALGLIGTLGALTFTGCSLTADQQDSLDKLVSKTEELIQVIENQNKQLSKADALSMLKTSYARTKTGLNNKGLIKITSEYPDTDLQYSRDYYYYKDDNRELCFDIVDGDVVSFNDAIYKEDVGYAKTDSDGVIELNSVNNMETYHPRLYIEHIFQLMDEISQITEEDIYEITKTETGYKLKFSNVRNASGDSSLDGYLLNYEKSVDVEVEFVDGKIVTFNLNNVTLTYLTNKDNEIYTKNYHYSFGSSKITFNYNSSDDVSAYISEIEELEQSAVPVE